MYNVIEYSSSVRVYDRVEECSEIKVFDDLIDIFDRYIMWSIVRIGLVRVILY